MRLSMRLFRIAAFAVIIAAGSLSANASLLMGTTVSVTYLYPDTSTVYAATQSATVGPGMEFSNYAGLVDIDISDTNILMTFTRNGGPNAVLFDGLHFVFGPSLGSVSINPTSTFTAFGPSDLTLSGTDLWVNFANLFVPGGSTLSLDVGVSSTPEPSSLLLLGTGLIGSVGAFHRKMKR
jgi:hypothetical protein